MNIISQPVYAVIDKNTERECRIMLREYAPIPGTIQIALVSPTLHAYAKTFVNEANIKKQSYRELLEFSARALDVVSVVSIDTENIEIDYSRQRNSFVNARSAAAKPITKTNHARGFAIDKSDFGDDVVRQRVGEFDDVKGVQSC
jgi:hypothetical protein